MLTQRLVEGWTLCATGPDETGTETWNQRRPPEAQAAPVPGIIQQVLPEHHGIAWYWCEFTAPARTGPDRLLLSFEAVDYAATVWVNGHPVGGHEGGDTPFTLDITAAVQDGPGNLLAVRVLNPAAERIDGIVLSETPHGNKTAPDTDFWPGRSYNFGGIIGEVALRVVPVPGIGEVFVTATLETGEIAAHIHIEGHADGITTRTLAVTVAEDQSGFAAARAAQTVPCGPGTTETTVRLTVGDVHPWDVDDPFLYRVTVTMSDGGPPLDETTVRTGFRQFDVRDGYFHLNGRRIYLRSTHTGNHYPLGQQVPPRPAFVRQDLIYAKAAGFNMVRFISGLGRPDQLAFCDEIGLLVYEEPASSWLLADSPQLAGRFDRSVREMVLRDRNHPSLVIWGLLNETREGAVFRHAVGALATVRDLDPTRLVLLSSGRWDGDLSIGSVANPGQDQWQHEWGQESSSQPPPEPGAAVGPDRFALVPGAGDLHYYPRLPESPEVARIVRTLGEAGKPVFLSEYGVGSLYDAVTEAADAAQWVPGVTPPDLAYTRSMAQRFLQDWAAYGMEGVYCFPQDALRASQAHQSRRRAVSFDLIRANPQIAGYNLTGMLDHALTGEGSWTYWRRWKPGVVEALADGWAPLRWCLFVTPAVAYPGDPVTLELRLASEDALAPGRYEVTVAVVGPGGWRREEKTTVEIPAAGAPLSLPVLETRLPAPELTGTYQCGASMGGAAAPSAGRAGFQVIARPAVPPLEAESAALAAGRLVIVDHPGQLTAGEVASLGQTLADGATVLVFCPWELIPSGAQETTLPWGRDIVCARFHDWLYHKECFAKPHPVFDHLPAPGLLDWEFYGDVVPGHLLRGGAPQDVASAAFVVGYPCPGGYLSGVLAATYPVGRGRLVVTTFDLLRHQGTPVADQLTRNLIHWAAG
ncbi:MAG TPA: glycoside hydrolase family 2 TIM barrel-domain containing protein [Streptosporangiaceae bacterium]